MRVQETCYGIIPLALRGTWEVCVVKHAKGSYWGFPKGHPQEGETPKETAERELQEETGLAVIAFLDRPPVQETYQFYRDRTPIEKTVIYFLAQVDGTMQLKSHEILETKWVDIKSCDEVLTFTEGKAMMRQLIQNWK